MNHASLFTGIGGFDLAAKNTGFKNIFQVEQEPFLLNELTRLFPNTIKYNDVRTFNGTQYRGTIDILSGGFPCQDISLSGKRIGINGKRSGLWQEFARIIGEIQPRAVLIENSPAITFSGLEQILSAFFALGYNAEWRSFFAASFGYEHIRQRTYLLAYSMRERCFSHVGEFGILYSLHAERTPRKIIIPAHAKRLNQYSDFRDCRIADGLPKGVDKLRMQALGNAVVTDIPTVIMTELFKIFTN